RRVRGRVAALADGLEREPAAVVLQRGDVTMVAQRAQLGRVRLRFLDQRGVAHAAGAVFVVPERDERLGEGRLRLRLGGDTAQHAVLAAVLLDQLGERSADRLELRV